MRGGGGGGWVMGIISDLFVLWVFSSITLTMGMAGIPRNAKGRSGSRELLISQSHPRAAASMGPGFIYTRSVGRCTAQFWSSRTEAWPKMVPHRASLSKVFGSPALEHYEPGLTLLEATQRNDDVGGSPYSHLVKESCAALLNSYARPGFHYDAWEVKTLLIQALASAEAAASQANQFALANHACI